MVERLNFSICNKRTQQIYIKVNKKLLSVHFHFTCFKLVVFRLILEEQDQNRIALLMFPRSFCRKKGLLLWAQLICSNFPFRKNLPTPCTSTASNNEEQKSCGMHEILAELKPVTKLPPISVERKFLSGSLA